MFNRYEIVMNNVLGIDDNAPEGYWHVVTKARNSNDGMIVFSGRQRGFPKKMIIDKEATAVFKVGARLNPTSTYRVENEYIYGVWVRMPEEFTKLIKLALYPHV